MALNRAFLKALGLEADAVDDVMAEYGRTTTKYENKISLLESKNEQYENDIAERDKEIKTLKSSSGDSEETTQKIAALEKENTDLKQSVKKVRLEAAVQLAVKGKFHDPEDAMLFIDVDNLELEDDGKTVKGLDEQINHLSEKKPHLFITDHVDKTEADDDKDAKKDDSLPPYNPGKKKGNDGKEEDLEEYGRNLYNQLFPDQK